MAEKIPIEATVEIIGTFDPYYPDVIVPFACIRIKLDHSIAVPYNRELLEEIRSLKARIKSLEQE